MNPLVITVCNSVYEKQLVNDFLRTLRTCAGFDDGVVVADSGLSKEGVSEVRSLGGKTFPVQQLSDADFVTVINRRAEYILEITDWLPQYTHVGLFDAGDIWFQRPIDGLWRSVREGVGMTEERHPCAEYECFNRWLSKLPPREKDRIYSACGSRNMFNAGMVAGERSAMRSFCTAWHRHIHASRQHFFGLCQVYANFLARDWTDFPFVTTDRTYNYVANAWPWTIGQNGNMIGEDGNAVAIGHNAGVASFPRVYNGSDIRQKILF